MIELACADEFIKDFESKYKLKISRIPLNFADGKSVFLLMCRCKRMWIALPYCSECYIETDNKAFCEKPPFVFVESQDGNLFCTRNVRWQIRDTKAWSSNVYDQKLDFELSFEDSDPIGSLPANVKRKMRRSSSLGVSVKVAGKTLVSDFYKVYSKRMHSLGSPAFGKRFLGRLAAKKDCAVFVAYYEGKPIGGAMLEKRADNSCVNTLFATDTAHNRLYTGYALHREMMLYAKEHGTDRYLLGRSTRHSGVHAFKRHFKPREIPLFWSYSFRHRNIREYTWLSKLWRFIPLHAANVLGSVISRRVY